MIVVAAGQGRRLGHAVPKAFVPLRGRCLLERSIRALASVEAVETIVPVVAADAKALFEALPLQDLGDRVAPPVEGGRERQDSVANGLAALDASGAAPDLVGVHDAARCLVRADEVERVVARAAETGAAILAVPARDTIKAVEGDRIVDSPRREGLVAAQTPQVFRTAWLRDALALARERGVQGTDDAQLVALAGHEVFVVEGSERNLKLTHPGDLALAEAWLDDEAADASPGAEGGR